MLLESGRATEPGVVGDVHEQPRASEHEVARELRIDCLEADEDAEAVGLREEGRRGARRVLARRVESPVEPRHVRHRRVLGEGDEAALVVEGQRVAPWREEVGRVVEPDAALAAGRVARSPDEQRWTIGSDHIGDGATELRVGREEEAHGVLGPDDEIGAARCHAARSLGEDPERVVRARDVETPGVRGIPLHERHPERRTAVVPHRLQPHRTVSRGERDEPRTHRDGRARLLPRRHHQLARRGRCRRDDERDEEGPAELRRLDPHRVRVERVGEEIPGRAEHARAGELERRPAGGGGEHTQPSRAERGEARERGPECGRGQRAHHLGHGKREDHRPERP